jgi:hypothetical protein
MNSTKKKLIGCDADIIGSDWRVNRLQYTINLQLPQRLCHRVVMHATPTVHARRTSSQQNSFHATTPF